jgi:hypothetical protein
MFHWEKTLTGERPTLSPNSEEPASSTSAGATLEGEYLSKFIDLLVRKGAQVIIQTKERR